MKQTNTVEPKYRVVTPEQYRQGYKTFHINEIPNMLSHRFELIRKLPDGNYLVKHPTQEQLNDKRRKT